MCVDWADSVVITFTHDRAFLMSFAISRRDFDSLDQRVLELLTGRVFLLALALFMLWAIS